MEAKGCAKCITWKESRRHFYWATRARVARSSALAKIAKADPDATFEYRSRLLDNLASIDSTTSYSEAAAKLERLDLTKTVAQTKADRLVRELFDMINQDRMAAVNGIVRLVDNLTDGEKATLQAVLQDSAKHMPGMSCRTLPCFRDIS
jgi:acetyl-CoA carboxylase/biotin carboxylase 1